MNTMIQVTQNNFKAEVEDSEGVVIADFYADWCGPCKMLSPLLESMSAKNTNAHIKFVKINVDQNRELAGRFHIMSIPTVLLFKQGKKVGQKIGVGQERDYNLAIEKALKSDVNAKQTHAVTIFTTPTCPYCHMAKTYLQEKHIPYIEVNVAEDHEKAREMIQKSGEMGVPQLWIDDEVVIGFNKPHIDAILEI